MVFHDKNSLGQNFIKFPSLVRELMAATDITADDLVIEIGSGKGIITKELRKKNVEVIAIEKDVELAEATGAVPVDFLEYALPRKRKYKIFSNIPFSKTSEIINKIMLEKNMPEMMYLIMQLEAAEKFAGQQYQTQSSVLTLPWFEVKILGEIDRTNFTLKPQVKIVFVEFRKREKPFIGDDDKIKFRKFVVNGFGAWKGTFLEAYKKMFTYNQLKKVEKMYQLTGKKPSEVSFDNWLLVFKTWKRLKVGN